MNDLFILQNLTFVNIKMIVGKTNIIVKQVIIPLTNHQFLMLIFIL